MNTEQAAAQRDRPTQRNNPLLWDVWLLAGRVVQKLKSKLLAWLFNAPGLYLGPGSIVRGVNHITFGREIYAHGNLWLEAVSQYNGATYTPSIQLGDHVSFSDGVHVSCINKIVFKKGILVGSKVYISDHNHGIYKGPNQSHPSEPPSKRPLGGGGQVTIGENVWIGDNAVLVGPLVIGDGAIIASNSVVRHDVAARTVVAGAPARPIRQFDEMTATWNSVRD